MTIHAQQTYLQKHRFAPRQIASPPPSQLGIVVVIPCHREPTLLPTLESLERCTPPACQVEVLLVFNSSEKSPNDVILTHNKQVEEIHQWKEDRKHAYHPLHFPALRHKHAGVGLARKIGMDEAVDRLQQVANPEGVIVCLDGDTTVAADYLVAIESHFQAHPKAEACSIYFEHPLSGSSFEPRIYKSITHYELFLRYFIEGQRYARFPHAYHTIGSAMAIRSRAYQARGGMNRRKAGEDFYFLHKFIPQNGFGELCSTQVFPSPRPSDRVPFGTGKAILEDLKGERPFYPAYDPRIFEALKQVLIQVPKLYRSAPQFSSPALQSWAQTVQFEEALEKVRKNVGQASTFPKRFFQWMDALRVLQFVHHLQEQFYPDIPITAAAQQLWQIKTGEEVSGNAQDWLLRYRNSQSHPWKI